MGIFSRIKKKDTTKVAPTDEPSKAIVAPKSSKTEAKVEKVEKKIEANTVGVAAARIDRSSYLLLSPRVSEKAGMLATKGTYVFNVPVTAEKVEIRKAVETLYNVTVVRVNTARGIGKVVHRGRITGRRNNWKKAIVTLKGDQKIDLYHGV